jgi:serine/threonine protein kinase
MHAESSLIDACNTSFFSFQTAHQVDVFSAGVTLYVMLCGYEPFFGESDDELIAANKKAKVDFPKGEWNSGKSFILVSQMMYVVRA